MGCRDHSMNAGGDLLLAGVRAGGEPEWARFDPSSQPQQLGGIERQRRGRHFEVAGRGCPKRPKRAKMSCLMLILRKTQIEGVEHGTDQAWPASPTSIGTPRQPGVDQHHWDTAGMR